MLNWDGEDSQTTCLLMVNMLSLSDNNSIYLKALLCLIHPHKVSVSGTCVCVTCNPAGGCIFKGTLVLSEVFLEWSNVCPWANSPFTSSASTWCLSLFLSWLHSIFRKVAVDLGGWCSLWRCCKLNVYMAPGNILSLPAESRDILETSIRSRKYLWRCNLLLGKR